MSRMELTFRVAYSLGFPERSILLDCYNRSVAVGISYTISTRISACNHYWVLECYE